MLWFILALLSALLVATHQMLIKKYVKNINEFVLSSGTTFVAAVILLTISFMRGVPEISPSFYSAIAVTASLNVIATILIYKALKRADLSLAMPMLAWTPAFLIFTSLIILGERPTTTGFIGIALTVIGSYWATAHQRQGILEPFKLLLREKGVLSILAVAFIYSITANFDKKMVLASDVYFGTGMTWLMISATLFILAVWYNHPIAEFKKNMPILLMLGTILAIAGIAANTALTMQIVPYVIAVKRLSTIFVVLYGIVLFKEKHAHQRLSAASLMVIGALVILFL